MFLYKSLNINILKRRLYFPQNTYVFLEKVVHVLKETRTCYSFVYLSYLCKVLRQKTKQNEKEKNVSVFSGWDSRFSEL